MSDKDNYKELLKWLGRPPGGGIEGCPSCGGTGVVEERGKRILCNCEQQKRLREMLESCTVKRQSVYMKLYGGKKDRENEDV